MSWKNNKKAVSGVGATLPMLSQRKAVSTVVATVIIIALTVTVGAVVWAIVSNLVGEQLEEGEACFGVLDQVTINNDFTCYNSTSKKMQFSISVGDIDIDGILVSVSFAGSSKSATLRNEAQNLSDVKNYPSGSNWVKIPGKNAGSTYFFEGITSKPASISIIPIVKNQQCGSTDTLHEIDDCQALLS